MDADAKHSTSSGKIEEESLVEGAVVVDTEALQNLSEEEMIMKLMGFGNFDTSHGKKIQTNHKGAQRGGARKASKRRHRQVMNRINAKVYKGEK